MNDYQKALDLENEEKNMESIKTKLKRVSSYEMFCHFYLRFLFYFYFYYCFYILYSSQKSKTLNMIIHYHNVV